MNGTDGDRDTSPVFETRTMPLAELHTELGACFATFAEHRVPADYGDPAAEVEALRSGFGLVDRSWVSRVTVSGADRIRFLSGLVTCDFSNLGPSQGAYGFFTQIKGRILADATLLLLDDAVWLELPAGHADTVIAHMSQYRIADQVDFVSRSDVRVPLTVMGPDAAAALSAVNALPVAAGNHLEARVHQVEVRVVRERRFGVPAWTLWVATRDAAQLTRSLIDSGARPAGFRALETVRIEEGRPRFGVDFGVENFPQETGLEAEAVSYTKGCYLGQEVVARIHYRGGVQRHLRGLQIHDQTQSIDTLVGAELTLEGRPVGRMTSVVRSSRLGGWVGLAIVHRKGADPGTELAFGETEGAKIVALPFDRDSI